MKQKRKVNLYKYILIILMLAVLSAICIISFASERILRITSKTENIEVKENEKLALSPSDLLSVRKTKAGSWDGNHDDGETWVTHIAVSGSGGSLIYGEVEQNPGEALCDARCMIEVEIDEKESNTVVWHYIGYLSPDDGNVIYSPNRILKEGYNNIDFYVGEAKNTVLIYGKEKNQGNLDDPGNPENPDDPENPGNPENPDNPDNPNSTIWDSKKVTSKRVELYNPPTTGTVGDKITSTF